MREGIRLRCGVHPAPNDRCRAETGVIAMNIDNKRLTASRALWRLRGYSLRVGARGLLALCVACAASSSLGCHSTAKTSSADPAMTPQEKAHRDQLAAMGREDAAAAKSKPSVPKRPTPPRDRRSGQRAIDQPRR